MGRIKIHVGDTAADSSVTIDGEPLEWVERIDFEPLIAGKESKVRVTITLIGIEADLEPSAVEIPENQLRVLAECNGFRLERNDP